jgi:hypothetical protein
MEMEKERKQAATASFRTPIRVQSMMNEIRSFGCVAVEQWLTAVISID